MADGRYLVEDAGRRRVLVIKTLGAPPPPRRRRRQPRPLDEAPVPAELPLSRVTVVRAEHPFADERAADSWVRETTADEGLLDGEAEEAIGLLNGALHAQAIAAAEAEEPFASPAAASAARIGYGSGDALAEGRFSFAVDVEPRPEATGRRRRRDEQLAPQQRVAAILAGRERPAACEVLVLRARRDLDAGRTREAALQLGPAVEALLAELAEALDDDGHRRDIAELRERSAAVEQAARAALGGEVPEAGGRSVAEGLALCERVLRRRRVLEG